MTKRDNIFEGTYFIDSGKATPKSNPIHCHHKRYDHYIPEEKPNACTKLAKMFLDGWLATWSRISNNYLAITLLLVVFLFSLLLPDISQQLHKNNELKTIKNVLDHMQDEVKRAEVACLTSNEKMIRLHNALYDDACEQTDQYRNLSPRCSRGLHATRSDPGGVEKRAGYFSSFAHSPNASRKEITLMSVLYTDSFDSQEKIKHPAPGTIVNK